MRSKYLNKIYDGWKVLSAVNTKGGHKSFILGQKLQGKLFFMTLRDSQLSKVVNNQIPMSKVVLGKLYQLSKNIRQVQNSITTF